MLDLKLSYLNNYSLWKTFPQLSGNGRVFLAKETKVHLSVMLIKSGKQVSENLTPTNKSQYFTPPSKVFA